MRAARFFANGVAVEDVEQEALPPGWVSLRVQACGICGSDLHAWSRLDLERGRIPGHEIAALADWTGADGDFGKFSDADADRVRELAGRMCVVDPRVACGGCDYCVAGARQLCRRGELIGITRPGGFAEYVAAPLENVHALPPDVTAREAVFVEPLAVVLHALRLARLEPQHQVLVLGGGSLGLLVAACARARVATVALSARYPHQRAIAASLGVTALADADLRAWATAHEPDVVIETVGGTATTLDDAVGSCRAGGRVIVLGLFEGRVPIDARALMLKELELIGSNTYGVTRRGSDFQAAIAWLPRLREDLASLATHAFPLERTEDALRIAADKRAGSIKVCLLVDEAGTTRAY